VTTIDVLRAVVRTQTQTDAADLPDPTIDTFLQQAFERTINAESRWPFYASTWELTQDPDMVTMPLPGDVNPPGIRTLTDKHDGVRLGMVPHEYAESVYTHVVATGRSLMYSVWGSTVYLWPSIAFSEPHTYVLRGYRKPLVWINPTTNAPDCDERLHMPLTNFATAMAYAQQEDEILEATYMVRWQGDVELAHKAIMEPVHHRPLVGAGSISGHYYPAHPWVIVPPG